MGRVTDSMGEAMKRNILLVADEHRKNCLGACNISLSLLRLLLKRAGISLTPEEEARFW